jgi:hypothetical protein
VAAIEHVQEAASAADGHVERYRALTEIPRAGVGQRDLTAPRDRVRRHRRAARVGDVGKAVVAGNRDPARSRLVSGTAALITRSLSRPRSAYDEADWLAASETISVSSRVSSKPNGVMPADGVLLRGPSLPNTETAKLEITFVPFSVTINVRPSWLSSI